MYLRDEFLDFLGRQGAQDLDLAEAQQHLVGVAPGSGGPFDGPLHEPYYCLPRVETRAAQRPITANKVCARSESVHKGLRGAAFESRSATGFSLPLLRSSFDRSQARAGLPDLYCRCMSAALMTGFQPGLRWPAR